MKENNRMWGYLNRARDIIVTIECKIILKVYANIKIDERESKDARNALVKV